MWEVVSYGERPYWDMSNQDVSWLDGLLLRTHIHRTNAHAGSFMSKFGSGWEFLWAVVALISGVTCWTWACSAAFISSLQMPVQLCAHVLVFTTLFTALACPPSTNPYCKASLLTHTQRHTQGKASFFSPLPGGYLHCTDTVTTAVSSQERKRNLLVPPSWTKYWSNVYTSTLFSEEYLLCIVLQKESCNADSNKAKKGAVMKYASNVCITFITKPTCSNESIKVEALYCSR